MTYEYEQEILRQVRANGDILRQIRDSLKPQPSEIERLAREVVRRLESLIFYVEAVEALAAAVEKEKP